jgi:hypothetical protein
LDNEFNPFRIADLFKWVGLQDNQIRTFAGFAGAPI